MMQSTVLKALELWGMSAAKFTLAAHRENTVFRVTAASGEYALRLHRVGYHTKAELLSELQWMAALRDANIRVPGPISTLSGDLIAKIDGVFVDILEWLPGTPVGIAGTLPEGIHRQKFCQKLGAAMAQLHDSSDLWTPPKGFTRPSWDRQGLVGDTPLWGPFWDNPMLETSEREMLLIAQSAANKELESIQSSLDYGLIHADLLSENIMLDGDNLYMIDFDDCGYGFRDFELATFLLRFVDAPDHSDLTVALCDGYTSRRSVNQDNLQLFLLLRALTYVGWIVPRMNEANGREKSAIAIKRALKQIHQYLT